MYEAVKHFSNVFGVFVPGDVLPPLAEQEIASLLHAGLIRAVTPPAA